MTVPTLAGTGRAAASDPPSSAPHAALSTASFTEAWAAVLPDPGAPVALSSPVPANLDGAPSVVFGDRAGRLYAFHLAGPDTSTSPPTPTAPVGWPTGPGTAPIDSTPSVVEQAGGLDDVLVGSGNDAFPLRGGYQAYGPSGGLLWSTPVVNPPSDPAPAGGVQAGMAVGPILPGGRLGAFAGSLGQVAYALDPTTGAPLPGWPFFDSDSTHATAAVADLYGTGRDEIVQGGDQTAGYGQGQTYTNGGHIRVLTGTGDQVCRADTDQVVDSSPAVGGVLAGGATGIVTGTGAFFPGATDTDAVLAFDTRCRPVWRAVLDGSTFSSPALSDVLGNGGLQVVEGTDTGTGGSVWALDGATGRTLWHTALPSVRVIGSVVTADLTGAGYDDVLAPTTNGLWILDGRTGAVLATLDPNLGLQNSPLVTADPNGEVGITLAGYSGAVAGGQGLVEHWVLPHSSGPGAVGPGSWPMFHHDAQLTGDAGGTPAFGSVPGCSVPAGALGGYVLAASDGGIFTYPGGRPFCGSVGGRPLAAPVVGMATAPAVGGYWEVASDGGVFAFGDAPYLGSMGGRALNSPVVGMAATPDGGGYWLVAADGGVFAFGDAPYLGSMGGAPLARPIVGIAPTADGGGYRLVAADGGVFAFGDAHFAGSTGGLRLAAPVVGVATDTSTGGYWLVAADGGVFAFGDAPFAGSTGGLHLAAPVVGVVGAWNGTGYRLAAADGGVFSFGVPFDGSAGGLPLVRPVVGVTGP